MAAKGKVTMASPFDLLLPYQRSWVLDTSRFKIWLKSRQIGGSLACAFEVVADAIESGSDWIILSAGERQALEFMEKVHRIGHIFCDAIEQRTGKPHRPETKASQIRFPNGARILALPANASTARGYSPISFSTSSLSMKTRRRSGGQSIQSLQTRCAVS
jgi:phage FluMu gp28-like protein